MAFTEWLQARQTHKYRAGWAYLDNYIDVGLLKIAGPTLVKAGEGYDEGDMNRYTARLPAHMDPKLAMRAIRDTFGGSSCQHEHDCCGCASHYVRVRRIGRRKVSFTVSTAYNY